MTNKFDHIHINLQPSYSLAAILIVSHCGAIILIWLLAVTTAIKILVTIAITYSCVYYLRQDALLLNNDAVIAFDLFEKMQCKITTHSKKSIRCLIAPNSFVTPMLTVLIFKLEKPLSLSPFCSVVILSDRIETNEFRRLRIWLRWKYRQSDTKKQQHWKFRNQSKKYIKYMRDPYTTGFWGSLVFLSDSFYEHRTQETLETQLCNGLYGTIICTSSKQFGLMTT